MAVEAFLGTRAQRAFISTIVTQAIVVLVMVAITFRLVGEHVDFTDTRYKTLPCYLALFAFAELFELLMAFDALRQRNTIQLFGGLIFHAGLVVFAALQIYETHAALVGGIDCGSLSCDTLWHRVRPFLIVAPIIILVSWFAMLFWVRALYFEFGWAIFHVVGANPAMKTMYQFYQVMVCLLKFDFFCFAGVTMQLLILVLSVHRTEFIITIIAIPVVLCLLAFCGVAVRREIKWLMTISLVLMLAAEAYFIYKLIRFFEPASSYQYLSTRATLTFFTIVAFVLLFATFAIGLRCFADFDKGLLASKMTDPERHRHANSKHNTPGVMETNGDGGRNSYFNGAPLQPRMSIE